MVIGMTALIGFILLCKCGNCIRRLHRFGRSFLLFLSALVLLNIRYCPAVQCMDTFKLTLERDLIAEPEVDIGLAKCKLNLIGTGLQCAYRGIQHLGNLSQEPIVAVRLTIHLQLTEQCFIFSRLCFCDNFLDLFLETAVKGKHHFSITESGRKRNTSFVEGYADCLCLIRFNADKFFVADSGNIRSCDVGKVRHGAIISLIVSIRSVLVLSASYSIAYAPHTFS